MPIDQKDGKKRNQFEYNKIYAESKCENYKILIWKIKEHWYKQKYVYGLKN